MTSDDMGISLNWYWIYALLLIGLASYWRRLARDNLANWKSANKLIPRSFENTDSAVERVRVGCIGLILSAMYSILGTICIILAVDLTVFNGELILARTGEILRYIADFLTSVMQWFLQVLRALTASAGT